ncbi:MAG: Cof-type HAD-IIB family hydrolase [Lachnospiraceae bacterium]|nr:Cof-type HAD-IIB family hydrolase [Lachnospiraceae bacterium]
MYHNPKAIILDLDGTLLRSDKSVSERTLKALEQCKNAGILVIVATARFWFKAEKYLEMIRPDYAILADGTQIYQNDEMIRGFSMNGQAVNGMIQALKKQEPSAEFVASTGKELLCSAPGISEQWRRSYAFEGDIKQPVYKIAAIMGVPGIAERLAEYYGCRLYSYRDENLYGFTAKEAGKYQAVCTLSKLLGIDLQDMVAFGDDENDYEILKYCGTGVAMANAIVQIREVADTITDSNDEDGVAAYLERYCTT